MWLPNKEVAARLVGMASRASKRIRDQRSHDSHEETYWDYSVGRSQGAAEHVRERFLASNVTVPETSTKHDIPRCSHSSSSIQTNLTGVV